MPHFSLDRVAEAARLGSTVLQGKRARDVLTAYIPTLVGCLRFAEEVAQGLTSGDFYETVQLARDVADVYGVELPPELLRRHGLEEQWSTWYVKLTLRKAAGSGDVLLLVSLHPLEQPMEAFAPGAPRGRRNGRLEPSW